MQFKYKHSNYKYAFQRMKSSCNLGVNQNSGGHDPTAAGALPKNATVWNNAL